MPSTDADIGYAALAQSRKSLKHQQHAQANLRSTAADSKCRKTNLHPLSAKHEKHLSDFLTNAVCNNDLRRATLSGKFITKIDLVDAKFRKLEYILLGNNNLQNLGRIEQFPYLRSLSLVNNLIERFEDIQAIEKLHHLEILHLEGCPITRRPNYIAYLISVIPTLKRLDHVMISKHDRELAHIAIVKQRSIIGIMIANEITIRIIQSIQCRIRLHSDLIQTAFGRVRIFNRNEFVPSLLHQFNLNEAVKILAFTQEPNREMIRTDMIQRVEMVWRSTYQLSDQVTSVRLITESWDHALSEAMAIQQERLASAISSAEISRCEAQNRINALIRKRSHPVDNFLRPTLQSELKETKRPRSLVSFHRNSLRTSTKDTTSLLDRVESGPVPLQTSPAPEQPVNSERAQESQPPVRIGQERIVELESLNLRLIHKLQQFQEQNRENVLQAENDAQIASSEIEKLSAALKESQQQVQYFKSDRDHYQSIVSVGINEDEARSALLNKVAELERLLESSQKQLNECKLEFANERKRLEDKHEQLRRCSAVHQFRVSKPIPDLKLVDGLFEEKCSENYIVGVYLSIESLRCNHLLRAMLRTWKSRIRCKHGLLRLKQIAYQRMIVEIWTRWILALRCTRYRARLEKRHLFLQWRKKLLICSKRKQYAVMMLNFRHKRCIRHSWGHWRRTFARIQKRHITPDIRAARFHTHTIVRCRFHQWRHHVTNIARPWRQKNLAAKYFQLIRCLSKTWSVWKEVYFQSRIDGSRFSLASIHHQIKLQRRVFFMIHCYAQIMRKEKNLNRQSHKFQAHRVFKYWHRLMKRRAHWKNSISEKRFQWDLRRLSVLFSFWLARSRLSVKQSRTLHQTIELDTIRSINAAYSRWRRMFLLHRASLASHAARIRAIKHTHFLAWSRSTSQRQRCRNHQQLVANRILEAAKRYAMEIALRRISVNCQLETRLEFISKVVQGRRCWKLIRCVFHQWITTWLLQLLTTLRSSLNEANSKLHMLHMERENLSGDAVRFADTATKLRDTILQQSLLIASKDSAFERLQVAHDALDDQIELMSEKENGLNGRIHCLESRCQSLLNERELLGIQCEEMKESLAKAESDIGEHCTRHLNMVRAIEAVLTESMIFLVSEKFRSADTLKEWMQQIIRHLQHMLFSVERERSNEPEVPTLTSPVISNT